MAYQNFYAPYGMGNAYVVPTYPQTIPNYQVGYQNQAVPMQSQQQVPGIVGRTIQRPEEVVPNDVPTNGYPAYFPTQDGSAIYVKHWNANGSIDTIRYVPETIDAKPKEDPHGVMLSEILERLGKLEKALSE